MNAIKTLLWALALVAAVGFEIQGGDDRLISQPPGKAVPATNLTVGQDFIAQPGQNRKLALADDVTIFVKDGTSGKYSAKGEIFLTAGEIYVDAKTFLVKTGQRQIKIIKGKVAVHADKQGTSVIVTHGEATVAGVKKTILAGYQLPVGATDLLPLPRASRALDWTKDLISSAALVPPSVYNGGALVARDPDGQNAKISLRKFHIDVHIEDGFARTTIDQTYFNQENFQLEGTFYFPLPPDASLSRLAMYVNGRLMEGGMAERDYARDVYESIRYANRDPALLEWVDGSTFKMRVFPLEPRTEKRIILSYAQRLPSDFGQTTYRFPAGHSLQKVGQWKFQARIAGGAALNWDCSSHEPDQSRDGKDLILTASAKKAATDRDVVLTLADPAATANARFNSSNLDGSQYLMLRYRPELKASLATRPTRIWMFLFETSADRDPLLGRVQIEVIRNLLANAAEGDRFLVTTAGTHVNYLAAAPQEVNPANIEAAVKFLEASHLVGALDVGNALEDLGKHVPISENPTYLVHVGSGIAAMGERRDTELVKKLTDVKNAKVRYVGVGVGRRWNRAFMKLAAEKTGGHFTQINPDEPIAWRAFDLWCTLKSPRLMNIEVLGDGRKFLVFEQNIAAGEELCAVGKIAPTEKVPAELTVRGLQDGQPVEFKVAVKQVAPEADYLPRAWAKLEIDRLLAGDALKNKDAIVALSKAMYIVTPFTSLMVLEHEDLYTQYKVDRNRKDRWALYSIPDQIPVVYEPLSGEPDPKALLAGGKQKADVVVRTVLTRRRPSILASPATGGSTQEVLEQLGDLRQSGANLDPTPVNLGNGSLGTLMLSEKTLTPRMIGGGEGALGGAATGHANGRMIPFLPRQSFEPTLKLDTEARNVPLVASTTITATGLATQQTQRPTENMWFRPPIEERISVPDSPPAPEMPAIANVRENARRAAAEWHRFWYIDQPSHMTATRVIGGIMPDDVSFKGKLQPTNSGQDNLFFDLLAYAPGMNTSQADIDAVLEAEALPSRWDKAGRVDAGAQELLAKARLNGWQTWTLPAEGKQSADAITFDGAGRYAYQTISSIGIKEQVFCDGQALVHLYPQLFVGATRAVSRFHRADFAEMVPWYLPAAEDLAHGVDLKLIDSRTIALVPHFEARLAEFASATLAGAAGSEKTKIAWVRQHLLFGGDGKLAERQVVQMPEQKVLLRQILDKDGTVRIVDKDNKELSVRKGKLSPAAAPNLTPETKNLVVMPLPYRTAEHVLTGLMKSERKNLNDLRIADALPLFAAHVGAGNAAEALRVFTQYILARNQRQLGYYVLLAACGVNLDSGNADVLAEHLDEPLAQYLALHSSPVLRKHASQWAVNAVNWKEDFLQHLSQTHALLQRWQSENVTKGDPARVRADRQKALAYVRANKDSAFGLALLSLMQDKAKDDKEFYGELADAWRLFAASPAFHYTAAYEHARCLYKSGQIGAASQSFQELYENRLKDDTLPAIDEDFRLALIGKDGRGDAWNTLMRNSARRLIEQKRRPDVLTLAAQCWRLGDEPLANALLAQSLEGIADAKERTATTLTGIAFLGETNQISEAAEKVRPLLSDKDLVEKHSLWRIVNELANKRDLPDEALASLEKALDVEYRHLPEVIDLQEVRADYGKLLESYAKLAESMRILKIDPPVDFVAKVVRAADRWRALDRDKADPAEAAAKILQRLGQRELAWDYLTTPIALNPTEAEPWLNMARDLARSGELTLAERAFKSASEVEPTNAQILWDRAQNLRHAGKERDAQPLFRRIADGNWQPRFQGLVSQARGQLGDR